ncbi:MAG: bifunctional [glutamate--ammonia ligase]-adenylyl-L-tyrosine phosphorylase/[glutamate--ammonia-ligase] adenylyltransferase [Betaproteobacteria bacterium]|nr:bifunctional [glutamate--ammonia ligase]-adenylyl-L-tyrosine phosphorylase/[glutamate--ammonia-ligase] adenylyltransferase [Betaproteobacteria bacterium]MDE2621970.1 bifunctional [glutamate--ammonia ligase]-adenylyl-L-tyrosine phosphorylase/[glutamate--ammonia-ligase] adenylyltransferase [Betaproteobacteria bacterium]
MTIEAREFSRYAARLIDAGTLPPELLRAFTQQPWTRATLTQRLGELLKTPPVPADNQQSLMRALRHLRQEVLLSVMTRDLNGQASLAEVTHSMTILAEVSICTAIDWLHRDMTQTHGTPLGSESGLPQELLVVAMGKLGGGELNVSSDIDLIFLYEEDGETDGSGSGKKLTNHEFFWRMGRRLNTLLSEPTEDGLVFRVDLRLRPNGTAGPLAVSIAMLEEYFIVQGRDWERYAWIKARIVSDRERPGVARGSSALAERVQPFVYRRHLDYSAISALRSLHRQIREETERDALRDASWRGMDIKLGRGGIREIEFVAQVFQLIRGGQDAALRIIPTLQVLERLGERGLLEADSAARLSEHYVYLRRLEHRLQYLDDAQTHSLPVNPEDLALVARSLGFGETQDFLDELGQRTRQVAALFDQIFPDSQAPSENSAGALLWQRANLEITDPVPDSPDGPLLHQLSALKRTPGYRFQSERTREQFDRVVIDGLNRILASPPLSPALGVRFCQFMESISRRASYLMLLADYPVVLARLLPLLEASEWAAGYIAQRPQLLDELLLESDEQTEDFSGYWQRFQDRMRLRLKEAEGEVEDQMNILRRARHAETFRVLVRDLRGELPVESVADRLSALADALMSLVLEYCWQKVPARHCEQPKFAIIAYGKWGSKEMGYASDLDLVFLYEDEDDRAQGNYTTLVRKISTWTTTATAAGILYEMDTQLRPNGSAGMLVSPLEAFRHYQMQDRDNSAWVWEHQALTRARFCCGDATIGAAFEKIRREVLCRKRDLPDLRSEILHMRQRIHEGHPNPSGRFDVKHDAGGMVDVEFIVQYLILAHAHAHPDLVDNVGNAALLRRAGQQGLIEAGLADRVADSYAALRRFQHRERLQGAAQARIDLAEGAPISSPVTELWQAVFTPSP